MHRTRELKTLSFNILEYVKNIKVVKVICIHRNRELKNLFSFKCMNIYIKISANN